MIIVWLVKASHIVFRRNIMAKAIRICKVCGKEYEYCKTFAPANKFRWQDVACSPECGSKYFAEVEAARNGNKVEKKVGRKTKKKESKPAEVIEEVAEVIK